MRPTFRLPDDPRARTLYWTREAYLALADGRDPAPAAREFVRLEETIRAEWASPVQHDWIFPTDPIALALLAGAGAHAAAGYARCVYSVHDSKMLLVAVPVEQRGSLDLAQLGWLALLRRDWRPLPAVVGFSEPEYCVIAELLAAAAEGSPPRIEAAIRAMVRRYDSTSRRSGSGEKGLRVVPSLLDAALRRVLPAPATPPPPPPAPAPRMPVGWFCAAPVSPEVTVPRRLPAVIGARSARLRDTAGHEHEFVVERLACGHTRVEPLADAVPAVRRLCLLCVAADEAASQIR